MKKIVVIALTLLVIGILGSAVTAAVTDTFTLETVKLHEESEINNSNIKNIKVNVSSSDIQLTPSESENIKVTLDGRVSEKVLDRYQFNVEENGESLHVNLDLELFFSIGVSIADLTVMIEVPDKHYKSIVLESSSGDIHVNQLTADELDTQSSSGDIHIDKVESKQSFILESSSGSIEVLNSTAPSFTASASSGDISFREIHGNIAVNTSSGEIKLDNEKVAGDFIAEASSGDVTVNYKESPTSLLIDFEGSSGDGDVSLENVNYEEKADDLIVGKIGDGKYTVKVRVSSGDFKLN
ncbi:lia operon protein LiaG [Bacillus mesophilus]|uniref:DUF4097 domain-containing protein n=1 Tax=Bacillus mesophilus TaxID=1808955 RepID=A0A6M0QE49_9BACI|nr:DUF4097 family beta strand repeat-containing protein [Bacillus mesophilus]MBM7663481.1 lia operon protein LiaG [Bacillus mesophilus]NEY74169.1 DUF4097 domain-containing protein [Bacillus mesophilus]